MCTLARYLLMMPIKRIITPEKKSKAEIKVAKLLGVPKKSLKEIRHAAINTPITANTAPMMLMSCIGRRIYAVIRSKSCLRNFRMLYRLCNE